MMYFMEDSVWMECIAVQPEAHYKPCLLSTVSSLHMHLQVANFQRYERAFTRPIT